MMILTFIILPFTISHAAELSCAKGEALVSCSSSICETKKPECPNYPTATCTDYPCDCSDMRWVDSKSTVAYTREECGLCPDLSTPVQCLVRPCADLDSADRSDKPCLNDKYADATCVDDYCGGCNFYFQVTTSDAVTTLTRQQCGYGEGEQCSLNHPDCDWQLKCPCNQCPDDPNLMYGCCQKCTYEDVNNDGVLKCHGMQPQARVCPDATTTTQAPTVVGCDTCESGEYFDGCNTCVCDDTGVASCTKKLCTLLETRTPYCIPVADTTTTATDVCSLPMDVGPCRGVFPRYYYDSTEEICKSFNWGGCEGNGNNFETLAKCEGACVQSSDTTTSAPDTTTTTQAPTGVGCDTCESGEYFDGCNMCVCDDKGVASCTKKYCDPFEKPYCVPVADTTTTSDATTSATDVCSLPMDIGPCDAVILRFYYNPKTETCESFDWGGCEPNGNNFETLADCDDACVDSSDTTTTAPPDTTTTSDATTSATDVCSLPMDVGPCRGVFPRYYYDSSEEICKEFNWGGCEGNENNFETVAECEGTCATEPTIDCETCESGEYFDGCNTCVCDHTGVASCTKKYCDPFEKPYCVPVADTTTSAAPDTTTTAAPIGCDTCESGVFTNGCQDCYCDDAGEAQCDDKVCVWEGIAKCYDCEECPNGYFDGCNECYCDEETGSAACTEMACEKWEFPICHPVDTTTSASGVVGCDTCETGFYFDGCKSCYCIDGKPTCDDTECKRTLEAYCIDCEECDYGYYDGCNDCKCDDSGLASCTKMACDPQGFPECLDPPGGNASPFNVKMAIVSVLALLSFII